MLLADFREHGDFSEFLGLGEVVRYETSVE